MTNDQFSSIKYKKRRINNQIKNVVHPIHLTKNKKKYDLITTRLLIIILLKCDINEKNTQDSLLWRITVYTLHSFEIQ